ncbi:uncharacterized protein LOC132799678 [Ziziphus jujuba]|uniref:Uncharacterized protein LOC132799678 n=1 Tax=Ziziphus jujuba TaxID=326968 RepID=A0ABM3ZUE4_ZIZJJ|nr:uncharacterized protein LOC132799678 [Ziziphus jujuba]
MVFTIKVVETFFKEYGIKLSHSTLYFTQANGQAKAKNKVLKGIIEKMVDDNPKNWHNLLVETLWAYRTSKKFSTGTTPFVLTYGHDIVLSLETKAVARAYDKGCGSRTSVKDTLCGK